MNTLVADNIDFSYPGGYLALNSASLEIRAGQKLAVLGANGAGKSTLLMTLNGTLRPSAGQVVLNGEAADYTRSGLTKLRSHVGLVFQDPDDQLFAATVVEDISFGPLNMGLPEDEVLKRVDFALNSLGIPHLSDRPTHMLSFGQRKRVSIAGVLAMRPDYLLLDEPTAGLDPDGIEELMHVLASIADSGTAVVIATHDMDVAYSWADELAVFSNHHVVASGRPENVFDDHERIAQAGLRIPILRQIDDSLRANGIFDATMPRARSVKAIINGLDGSDRGNYLPVGGTIRV